MFELFNVLPVAWRIGGLVAIGIGILYLHHMVYQQGFEACTAQYQTAAIKHEEEAAQKIKGIRNKYNDLLVKNEKIGTNTVCGPAVNHAIGSLQ